MPLLTQNIKAVITQFRQDELYALQTALRECSDYTQNLVIQGIDPNKYTPVWRRCSNYCQTIMLLAIYQNEINQNHDGNFDVLKVAFSYDPTIPMTWPTLTLTAGSFINSIYFSPENGDTTAERINDYVIGIIRMMYGIKPAIDEYVSATTKSSEQYLNELHALQMKHKSRTTTLHEQFIQVISQTELHNDV